MRMLDLMISEVNSSLVRYIHLLFLTFLLSCSSYDTTSLVFNTGKTQGTYYHIKYMSDHATDYQFQIDSILQEVDTSLSIYKSYSLVSQLNNQKDLKTDTLFNSVFFAAKKIFLETEGNFDCSVFPLLNEWGFYKDKLGDSILIDSNRFRSILNNVGFDKIQLLGDSLIIPRGMMLDFNSIAQGFTVDLIGRFLEQKGVSNYLIEIGGEILAKGRNDDGEIWRVGVEKPSEAIDISDRFQFIIDLENKALATSGNYRKFYEKEGVKYSHTINPFTGFPAQNKLLSVTVLHDDCMLADAYATAFMVMGVAKTRQFISIKSDLAVYLVYIGKDGNWETYISPEIQGLIIN